MSQKPEIVVLPCIVQGSTWDGFSISATSTGQSLASPLTGVSMEFKDSSGTTVLTLAVGSGITITDASSWAFTAAAITPFPLASGNYTATIEATNASGLIRKWLRFQISVIAD